MRFWFLVLLPGCCSTDFITGGGGSDAPEIGVGETREIVTRSRTIGELINAGSQQGRPDPPMEVMTRSQCSSLSDGGEVDSNGVTGRIECGEQLVGHTRGGVQEFDTRFYEANFCTPATTDHSGGDERIYRLSVPDGRLRPWVTLDTPCADLDLAVIKWSGTSMPSASSSVNDCEMFPKDGTTREIVDVTSDRATEWLIVVEGKGSEEGAFGLTVQCVPW